MAKIVDTIYFHREKESNWELEKKARLLGWANSSDMTYIGSEVKMRVEIENTTNVTVKVLEINGVDVSDKEIYL